MEQTQEQDLTEATRLLPYSRMAALKELMDRVDNPQKYSWQTKVKTWISKMTKREEGNERYSA